jgi:hypothetical protein
MEFKNHLIRKGDGEEAPEKKFISNVNVNSPFKKPMKQSQGEDYHDGKLEKGRTDAVARKPERMSMHGKKSGGGAGYPDRSLPDEKPPRFGKAMTAGSSSSTGSNMMHATPDGVEKASHGFEYHMGKLKPKTGIKAPAGQRKEGGTYSYNAQHLERVGKAMTPILKGLDSLVKAFSRPGRMMTTVQTAKRAAGSSLHKPLASKEQTRDFMGHRSIKNIKRQEQSRE